MRIHFEHAHNLVLDLALWLGVPLAVLVLMLLVWPLRRLLRGADPRLPALLMATGAVLMHSMVEFAIEYAYFLIPAGLLLGAAHRMVAASSGVAVPRTALRATGWALIVALVITVLDYLQAEQSYRTLRLEAARIGAARVAPESAPELRVLTQLHALLSFARQAPRPGMDAHDIAVSRRAAERFAYPPAQFRHAQVLALNGDNAGAERMLALLCAMHPRARCQEAVDGWLALVRDKPVLGAVRLPDPTR